MYLAGPVDLPRYFTDYPMPTQIGSLPNQSQAHPLKSFTKQQLVQATILVKGIGNFSSGCAELIGKHW